MDVDGGSGGSGEEGDGDKAETGETVEWVEDVEVIEEVEMEGAISLGRGRSTELGMVSLPLPRLLLPERECG